MIETSTFFRLRKRRRRDRGKMREMERKRKRKKKNWQKGYARSKTVKQLPFSTYTRMAYTSMAEF